MKAKLHLNALHLKPLKNVMVLSVERMKAMAQKAVKEGSEHCTFCDRDGNKREGCFKLIGYPEW